MAILRADVSACQGYANCVVGADDYYDLDDEGMVITLRDRVGQEDRARVEAAANSCPASALWLEEE